MAFDTQLTPEQEMLYRKWMIAIGHTPENGMAVDNNLTGTDYDYRGFFAKNGAVPIGRGQHFTDEFKKPNHPRFSVESKYSGRGNAIGGTWSGSDGETFNPSSFTRAVSQLRAMRRR